MNTATSIILGALTVLSLLGLAVYLFWDKIKYPAKSGVITRIDRTSLRGRTIFIRRKKGLLESRIYLDPPAIVYFRSTRGQRGRLFVNRNQAMFWKEEDFIEI